MAAQAVGAEDILAAPAGRELLGKVMQVVLAMCLLRIQTAAAAVQAALAAQETLSVAATVALASQALSPVRRHTTLAVVVVAQRERCMAQAAAAAAVMLEQRRLLALQILVAVAAARLTVAVPQALRGVLVLSSLRSQAAIQQRFPLESLTA